MKILSKLLSSALLSAGVLTSSVPVNALPMPQASTGVTKKVEQVQWRDRRGWYHGHRGYRDYRPGYRRYSDGFWYPLAAFGAGALIGGAIANRPREAGGLNPRHVEWCASRYRSYRASDNTYVPRAGIRAECTSPYY